MSNSHDDDEVHKDLTSLEDLSEFLHEEDPDLDSKFDDYKDGPKKSPPAKATAAVEDVDKFDLGGPPLNMPSESEEITENNEEVFSAADPNSMETSSDFINSESTYEEENSEANIESSFDENSEFKSIDDLEAETQFNLSEIEVDNEDSEKTSPLLEDDDFFANENLDVSEMNSEEAEVTESLSDNEFVEEPRYSPRPIDSDQPEKFEDVKNFAQNFSYGTIEGAGNPPYSVIIKNIKFKEDADDVLTLLRELAIIDSNNEKDYEQAIYLGSVLIPQISEFTAIVIAHKLRRFDLDIEVGLSDEIHPPKAKGDNNPRGLTKKAQIKQNREEEFRPIDRSFTINEILMTTNSTIEGYEIKEYLGIDHAHTFIDEEELERLHFISKGLRENNSDPEDLEHYKNYKDSFNKIHDDLLNEIKQRAYKLGANALIGIQFSMNQTADYKKSQYQLSCSATCTFVEKN